MENQELKLTALQIALDRGGNSNIDEVLESAEKIYSYLVEEGVDNQAPKARFDHIELRKFTFPCPLQRKT